MSAVQLLEQLGANADHSVDKELIGALGEHVNQNGEVMWCLMFPAEDDENSDKKDEDKDSDSEKKDEITH